MTLNRSLAAALLCALPCLAADGLDPTALLRPPTDTWPTYNGDYSGRRYSPLSQINQSNVYQLSVAWIAQLRSGPIKSTPLEVNGVIYLTTPDNVWALDARTSRTIWHYVRESQSDQIGSAASACIKTGSTSKRPTATWSR